MGNPEDTNEAERRFKKIFEKYPKLIHDTTPQTQEAQRIAVRIFF